MKIEIPFNEWSKDKLDKFIKNATSRNKQYGEKGDTFDYDGVRYEIVFVAKLPLWFIAKYLFKSEGAESDVEFIEVWIGIHPRARWTPNKEVFYHYFKPIGRGV